MNMRALDNRWVYLGLRLLVGAVFLYAGIIKLSAPQAFADSIATFRLLPPEMINLLALGLPLFEAMLGAMLLTGAWRRTAALGALGLCGMFALALALALLRGIAVDCGCLGSHDALLPSQNWVALGRDGLLGAAASIIYKKRDGNSQLSRDDS